MEAYVLINTEPRTIWKVAEAALKVKGVTKTHTVAGQFDAVAFVKFPKMDELGEIIEKIQHIEGVRQTQTLIVVPPTIRE